MSTNNRNAPPSAPQLRSMAFVALLLLTAGSVVGCRPIARALVSDGVEVKLGESTDMQLSATYALMSEKHPASVWVNGLVDALSNSADSYRDSDDFGGYKVRVLDEPELVNAFAAPGGFVYVSTGLIDAADDCDQVAGVVAHELAHVTERHGVSGLGTRALLLVVSLIVGSDAPVQIAMGLVDNGFSRGQETDADEVGLAILEDAGFDPNGMAEFFEMLDESEGMPGFMDVLSTHPDSGKRARRIREELDNTAVPERSACESLNGLSFEEVRQSVR